MKKLFLRAASGAIVALLLASCNVPEMTREQIAYYKKTQKDALVAQTVRRPGSTEKYPKGTPGGTWYAALNNDPKSFNSLHAQDAETAAITGVLSDYLLNYDAYTRTWKPSLASYQVKVNEQAGTMDVIFTLRDDLYWTSLADPGRKVKVTSDDVVYWYNDIIGDPALQQSEYTGEFIQMPDGSTKRVTIQKLDDRRFVLHYPRILAEPEISSDMTFGPRYIFEPVKKAKGVDGVMNLWAIDTDPRTIPSLGPYYIASYRPGVSVTLTKNPYYWKKDDYGQPIPYITTEVYKIIPNQETEKLKFLAGEIDGYNLRPEDLKDLVQKHPRDYTVYFGGPSLGASFITWNENPTNLAPKYVRWFTSTKFRQAMSCFFDRERIIKEVYRGLADPAIYFFAKGSPFYNPDITEQYLYDPARGKKLLAEIGIKPNKDGMMEDSEGNPIDFTINTSVETNIGTDIANIYADDLKKVGITMRVKPIDFPKLVDKLMKTYDWQAATLSLTGGNYFPVQGNNVWPSSANLHLWHPLEKHPATPWEAEIDKLYYAGYTTRDHEKAKEIWDKYQKLILDQLPLMYTVYPDTFSAYRNRWANIRVDNLGSPDLNYVYLKQQ